MELTDPSLANAELSAAALLVPELREHGLLSMDMFNVMSAAMDTIPEMRLGDVPQSLKVAVALFIRITNDLRAASMLALRGYPTQAGTLAASLYEAALTVVYVGRNDSVAQAWIDHDDPTKLYMPIKKLTNAALAAMGTSEEEQKVSILYKAYRQLCMAKHSSPLYQMQHAYTRSQGVVRGVNGPDTSEHGIRAAWFSLEHCIRLCLLATVSFVLNFVPVSEKARLRADLDRILGRCDKLSSAAVARFGSKDPFQGKW